MKKSIMIKKNDKIFLAGHNGLVGSAVFKKLKQNGYKKIITVDKKKLNLLNQEKVFKFLRKNKPSTEEPNLKEIKVKKRKRRTYTSVLDV